MIRQMYTALNTGQSGLPSTAAAVERLFSLEGRVLSPLHSRLSSAHFETMTFIRLTNWFISLQGLRLSATNCDVIHQFSKCLETFACVRHFLAFSRKESPLCRESFEHKSLCDKVRLKNQNSCINSHIVVAAVSNTRRKPFSI